ncbi:MAG: ERCC4 domain-containing protein [Planctomycetota bacterium]|jgi:ERCC4-type nuclease
MIQIDDRVGSAEIAPYLSGCGKRKLCRLEFGDFAFEGRGEPGQVVKVGVERKTVGDFIQSLTHGRLLSHQLPGMAEQYDRPYLLIEGGWGYGAKGCLLVTQEGKTFRYNHGARGFSPSAISSALQTISVMGGVPVIRAYDMKDSGNQLSWLYAWWQKGFAGHKSLSNPMPATPAINGSLLRRPSTMERIASCLPGIGGKGCKVVAKAFPSLEAMAWATEEDWVKIEGVGKVTAKKCMEVVRNG